MNTTVKCPTCKSAVKWSKESTFRPFCSKRCRLIDLGEWASESHSIPGQSLASTDELTTFLENEKDKI